MRAILAAGGTAGHINPALAIADRIADVFPGSDILFIGTDRGMESKLTTHSGYRFASIKATGLKRRITPRNIAHNFKAAYYFLAAEKTAEKMIKDFKPDIVIGTGSYVTVPVLRAAAKLGIKTAAHESNSLPGAATKMLAKTADKVFAANSDALKRLPQKYADKYKITGNPMRINFTVKDRAAARRGLGLPDGLTVLSFGGSLGANRISEAVIGLLKWEAEKGGINHIHSYGGNGKALFENIPASNRNIFAEYFHNMYDCMAAADLVISRAGSMTLTEIKAFGRASVLIPWQEATENHQYFNAKTMSDAGAAVLIEDKDVNPNRLIEIVSELLGDLPRIRLMEENASKLACPGAANEILSEILSLINNE